MNRRDFLKSIAAAGAGVAGGADGIGGTSEPERPGQRPAVPAGEKAPHHFYDWKGSPYEIGYQHGSTLRNEIVTEAEPAVESLARARRTSREKALAHVVAAREPLYREHVPSALEEIRGIGEGSGLGYDYAFFAATRDGMRLEDCTAITCGKAATIGGKVLIGQNKDTDSALDRYRIMRLSYASGRRMLLLNYPGWIANIGLTSDGVAFTGNTLYAQSPPGDLIPSSLFKRIILEKKSVREILAATEGFRLRNGCICIGDSGGHLVCVEFANGRRNVRDVSNDVYGHANSITCDEFKCYDAPAPANSPVRQRNVVARLAAVRGRITPEVMQGIFADHVDFPFSICRHRDSERMATTASFVADLTDLEMHIAIGNPCAAGYRRYPLNA